MRSNVTKTNQINTPATVPHLYYFSALFISLLSFVSVNATAADLNFLTPAEQAWLTSHPVIRVAPDLDWSPYEWVDSKGKHRGISADYLKIISNKLGIRFEIIQYPQWSEALDKVRSRDVDLLSAVVPTPGRAEFLLFTAPYSHVTGVIVSTMKYQSVEELMGKKVAVATGYYWDEYITQHKVDVTLVRVEDSMTALEFVAMGAVDAMAGDLASTTELINRSSITNLRIVKHIDEKLELSLGVRNDWPQLTIILNKTLATITQQQHDAIRLRWVKLIDTDWWRNSTLQKTGATVIGFFLLVLLMVMVWNRTLARRVQQRAAELQQAQQQLIQAAKLKSIGQLAAGVAHEVKNPLAIIRMGIEFLSGGQNADETELEILRDMEDAVERANTVVHGLLDFSRDQELQLQQGGDINEVISKSLHFVEHELQKKQIVVRKELVQLPAMALDFSKLQQVFINLFINSIHAMEKQGTLLVITRLHDQDTETAVNDLPDYLTGIPLIQILVKDNGSGIDEKEGGKIFDPFYTTKEVGQGTGLGLSVCLNIIELHHGTLQLANHKDGGACATILLPCN